MITRQRYIDNQRIIRNRMIKQFTRPVYDALQSQIKPAIEAVKKNGIKHSIGKIHGDILNKEIGGVVTELYKAAAIQAKKKYIKPKVKSFGSFGDNLPFVNQVIDYFKKHLLQNVVNPISQTTVKFIDDTLQKAITNGWGVDKTIAQLKDSDITKNRARMIVRTETVKATNFTQMAAANDEDYEMNKEWIAVEDNRTRRSHSHAGVDGEKQQLTEPYSNGLMFPGDPNGELEEIINCRCTQGYSAVRDSNGRIIAKRDNGNDFLTNLSMNQR